jgi:hypothetical protein
MTVKTQEEEIEIIKAALDKFPRYKNVEANERMLLEACQGKPINSVPAVLRQIESRLAVNPAYEDAYAALWSRYPELKTEANIGILDERISVYHVVDADTLVKLVENPNVRKRLVLTHQASQAIHDEAERLRLIEEILQGKDVYEWRGNVDGRLYSGTRAELEQDDLPRLREINEIVQAQRALYARDTKEVRAEQRATELRTQQLRAGLLVKKQVF